MAQHTSDESISATIQGLVHERDARREFGQDPDGARVRPASVVERYKQ
jgi:uncharacterized protein DUF2630